MSEKVTRHREAQLLLPWYVNATLSAAEQELLDQHLQECRECRQELRKLRLLRARVSDLAEETEEPPGEPRPRRVDDSPRPSPQLPAKPKPEGRAAGFEVGVGWKRVAAVAFPLLLVVLYQNIVAIPSLQKRLSVLQEPVGFEPVFLTVSRAAVNRVSLAEAYLHLEVDVGLAEPSRKQTGWVVSLRNDEDRSILYQLDLPTRERLHLRFPAEGLPEGRYTLLVAGSFARESGTGETREYPFVLSKK